MNSRSEDTKELSMEQEITCDKYNTVFRITPSDCKLTFSSLKFWVKCPHCQKDIRGHARDVGPHFWLKMNY